MNNITKTILFSSVCIASLLLMPFGMNNAYAEHDLPTDYPFSSGTQSICMNTTQMNNVKVDGSTGKSSTISTAASNAVDMYDSKTAMTLTYSSSTSCADGKNMIGAKLLREDAGGVEYDLKRETTSHYVTVYLNTHTSRDYDTSSTCGWLQEKNPEYIYKHELGHFAGLDHTESFWTSGLHSIMKPLCNSGYANLSTDDITQIDGFYN